MNLDATAKRFFPLILCVLIALIAYFQASGIAEMVAAKISDAPASKPRSVTAPPLHTKLKSGKPILHRNAFDSVTGPLDGTTLPSNDDGDVTESADGEPSDEDPSCSFGSVNLIMTATDPEWSFASISAKGDRKLRRIGDEVEGHTVEAMAWDRVYFVKDKKRCQMLVSDRSKDRAAPPKKTKIARKRKRSGAPQLDADVAAKIHKLSDNEFNIERSVVDEILEKQAELMRYTRMRPVKDGDKVVGLRMSRIRSGTLLDVLGLKNGDMIQSINGFSLTDPQKALEAYGRLRTADKLSLQIKRGGSTQTIDYNIQ